MNNKKYSILSLCTGVLSLLTTLITLFIVFAHSFFAGFACADGAGSPNYLPGQQTAGCSHLAYGLIVLVFFVTIVSLIIAGFAMHIKHPRETHIKLFLLNIVLCIVGAYLLTL